MVDRYFLLGEHVSLSLSPAMMNAAFRSESIDAVYEAVSVGRSDFEKKFTELKERAAGFNLTIPFKSDVIPMLDELDEVSRSIHAVNVVKRVGDRHTGYNTDVGGIVGSLKAHGRGSIRSALLIGAGGAARAFCEAMNELRCARVTVAARDSSKAEAFVREMEETFERMRFDFTAIARLGQTDADVIFNATPIGSGQEQLPDGLKRVIYGRSTVFDAVYRPMKTELIRIAELRGCKTIYGYEMLLGQGTRAFEIWTGREAPREIMKSALLESLEVSA